MSSKLFKAKTINAITKKAVVSLRKLKFQEYESFVAANTELMDSVFHDIRSAANQGYYSIWIGSNESLKHYEVQKHLINVGFSVNSGYIEWKNPKPLGSDNLC